jgi:cytochrome c-type biogenesis protein CcmH
MKRITLLLGLLFIAAAPFGLNPAQASIATYEFATPEDEARFTRLSEELRCLVCQNQSLADSNAELALDLRREIYEMIRDGKSNEEIVTFMVARYGDFVLYRPPVKPSTFLLWTGPFLLFALGVVVMIMLVRRRGKTNEDSKLSADEQRRLQQVLHETGEKRL